MVLIYIFSPKTDLNFYIFAAALGFTWLATVAPTAAVTGKLFGTRYLATLFGLVMLTHQIGGFLGSYIGAPMPYSPARQPCLSCPSANPEPPHDRMPSETFRRHFPNTPPVAGLHGTQISLIKPQITAAIKPPFK